MARKAENKIKEAEEYLKNYEEELSKSDEKSEDEENTQTVNQTKLEATQEKNEDYKQKYTVLQGKYDSEVPVLSDKVKALERQMKQLESEKEELQNTNKSLQEVIASMSANVDSDKPTTPTRLTQNQEEDIISLPSYQAETITDDELEEYGGQKYLNYLKKVIRNEMSILTNQLTSQITEELKKVKTLVGDVTENIEQTSRQNYFRQLTKLVPDWKIIGQDNDFYAWAQSHFDGKYSTTTLHQIAAKADEAGDYETVANIMNAYKAEKNKEPETANENTQETNATNEVVTESVNKQEVQSNEVETPSIEELVSPEDVKSENIRSNQRDVKITNRFIADFYRDQRLGKYDDKPEEAEKIQKMIFKATAEGAVERK